MSIRQKYDGQIGFFIDAGAHSSFFKKNLSGSVIMLAWLCFPNRQNQSQ